jgi:hypothetical protein
MIGFDRKSAQVFLLVVDADPGTLEGAFGKHPCLKYDNHRSS